MEASIEWFRSQMTHAGGPIRPEHARWMFVTFGSLDDAEVFAARIRTPHVTAELLPEFVVPRTTTVHMRWFDEKPRNFTAWIDGVRVKPKHT